MSVYLKTLEEFSTIPSLYYCTHNFDFSKQNLSVRQISNNLKIGHNTICAFLICISLNKFCTKISRALCIYLQLVHYGDKNFSKLFNIFVWLQGTCSIVLKKVDTPGYYLYLFRS